MEDILRQIVLTKISEKGGNRKNGKKKVKVLQKDTSSADL